MPNKKRSHLQQFDIIHLSNSDLTYMRNLREKQYYLYHILLLENLHQELFPVIIFIFSTLPHV
jgi:hypothetical protein